MTASQLNDFLRRVAGDPAMQQRLRRCDARAAAQLAGSLGFEVTVGDLIRYKSRATTWQLTDAELAVVAEWQAADQPFWWQHIWPLA